MTKFIYILIFVLPMFSASAENLFDRLVDFTKAGRLSKISYPEIIYSSDDLGFVSDGTKDNSAYFNTFIDTVSTPVILVLEPGEYLFSSPIRLKSGVIISGYNSNLTFLQFDFGGEAKTCVNISGSASNQYTALQNAPKRNDAFLITTSQLDVTSGDLIELRQENGDWDSNPADWAKYSVGQHLTIDYISNDTIFTKELIYIDYSEALNPEFRKVNPIQNVVLQYLNIERVDEPETGAGYNIGITKAYNCAVRGIESNKSVGSHIMIAGSKNIEVSGCYIHDAFTYDGSGTRGYGVTLNDHASDCKIENNIFRHLRHAMMTKHGANGNAIAYNYALETHRSEPISDFAGDIQLHGHFSYANLIESNIVQNIWIDEYWGPSGPYNTFLRNRTELYGFFCTSSQTDTLNIIANEITGNGIAYGLFNVQGEGHYFLYNNIKGKLDNTESNLESLPVSFLYTEKPKFWDIPDDFPAIGSPNLPKEYTIPAKFRYETAVRKTVGEYLPTGIFESKNTSEILKHIKDSPNKRIRLYNYIGCEIFDGMVFELDFSKLHNGLYFVFIDDRYCKICI